jgi:hypothetical protein
MGDDIGRFDKDIYQGPTEYMILNSMYAKDLSVEVNKYMKKGWYPKGGVALDRDYFYQAMVR